MLIVLERGARATFVEEYRSEVPGYLNVVVELIVADEAQLEYVTIQHHHSETRQFGTHRATVGRDAELDWVAAALGGTRAKSRMESLLAGQGAQVKVTGAYYLTGREHIDYDTTQEHAAPNTISDLAFKGVLDDRARAVWRGRDPRRQGRAEDRRLPGEPQPAAVHRRPGDADPRPRDRGQRRPLHPRRHRRPGRQRPALLPDGPRARPAPRPSG